MPRFAPALAFAAALLFGCPALAEEAIALSAPAGGCPGQLLIREQLAALVGARPIEFTGPAQAAAVVVDDGDRYSIVVGPARRDVVDASRNCLERARVAAVFIAMNVPAREAAREAPKEPAPRREAAHAVDEEHVSDDATEQPQTARTSAFGAQVRFEASVATEYDAAALGVSAGPSVAVGAFEIALLIGFSGPTTLAGLGAEGRESVELLRFPARLVLSPVWRTGTLEFGPEVGGFAGGVRIRGDQVPGPETSFRLEGGVFAGGFVRWRPRDRFAVGTNLNMLFSPYRYELLVGPGRGLGETPALWLTGGISLAYQF